MNSKKSNHKKRNEASSADANQSARFSSTDQITDAEAAEILKHLISTAKKRGWWCPPSFDWEDIVQAVRLEEAKKARIDRNYVKPALWILKCTACRRFIDSLRKERRRGDTKLPLEFLAEGNGTALFAEAIIDARDYQAFLFVRAAANEHALRPQRRGAVVVRVAVRLWPERSVSSTVLAQTFTDEEREAFLGGSSAYSDRPLEEQIKFIGDAIGRMLKELRFQVYSFDPILGKDLWPDKLDQVYGKEK